MNSIHGLATFFGWCTVLNLAVLIFVFLTFAVFSDFFARLLAKVFRVSETCAKETLLRVLMQYRILFVVFNLVPYIALKIMIAQQVAA